MCSNAVCFGFVGVLQRLNLTGENMKNEGLTLNQLAERNAELVTEVEKLRDERDQLAAENVALKDCVANHAPAVDHWNAWADQEYKIKYEPETTATDRIVAGFKADGVEEFAAKLRIPGDDQFFDALAKGVALAADDFAKQLREGEDK